VATVAIGNGWNAGVLAAQILAISTTEIAAKIRQELQAYKLEMEQIVSKMNEQLPRL
jgi:phosphoribosylcarboxyaminoimidazole (NCAIR) mutase